MDKKSQNKGFLLRLDPDTMEIVERWAAEEFRSVNGQLQWIINDAINRYKKRPKKQGNGQKPDSKGLEQG